MTASAARGSWTSAETMRLRELYYDNEAHDGYRRDQNVFGPGVTTEDNLAVIVDYERGATLSYALNAHSPWEGYRIAINGTEGRAELEVVERAAVLVGADGNVVLDPSALPESELADRWAATHAAAALGGGPGRPDRGGRGRPRRRRRPAAVGRVPRARGRLAGAALQLGRRRTVHRGRHGGQRVAAHRAAGHDRPISGSAWT